MMISRLPVSADRHSDHRTVQDDRPRIPVGRVVHHTVPRMAVPRMDRAPVRRVAHVQARPTVPRTVHAMRTAPTARQVQDVPAR